MKIIGKILMPGDKSISHRAIMLGSIASGESTIHNIPESKDVLATINCLELCGLNIHRIDKGISIKGGPLKSPQKKLDCMNSGTTARLLLGLLSGESVSAHLYGDHSLSKRPMNRVIEPLRSMGVEIVSNNNHLPIDISSTSLKQIDYYIPIPSAQVKSCIMLASLGCKGISRLKGCINTRDHLERMLSYLCSDGLKYSKNFIEINPSKIRLNAFDIKIPGDASSASFFIGLASLLKGSELIIENLLLNKHRIGFIKTLQGMGANIVITESRYHFNEKIGTVTVKGNRILSPCNVASSSIPSMIDEIPILSLLCSYIDGTSTIEGLNELKYKESNRYECIIHILEAMGVDVAPYKLDGIIIKGKNKLYNTSKLNCYNDHRLAMMISIAQILSVRKVHYDECIDISFPSFKSLMRKVLK